MSVIVNRVLPTKEAADALITPLQAALGEYYAGFTCRKDHIEVFLKDGAPEELQITALKTVIDHNFSLRTEAQIRDAKRREKRLALRDAFKSADTTIDSENLAHHIEWLTMELAYLLERVGENIYE